MSNGIEVDNDMTDEAMGQQCAEALEAIESRLTDLVGVVPLRTVFFLAVPLDDEAEVAAIGAGLVVEDVAKVIAWLQEQL